MIEQGTCPRCYANLGFKARFCTKCGHQVETTDPIVCRECLTPIGMWDERCSQCDAAIVKPLVTLRSLEGITDKSDPSLQ